MNAAGKYLPASERAIAEELPARPAAVMVYSAAGECRALFLDFDSGKVAPKTLDSDLLRVRIALGTAGIRFFEDSSISRGHHIYVPLAAPLHGDRARAIVETLAASLTSLDPSPHRSIASGCIRVPGSRHRKGGHQELISTPAAVEAAFSQPAEEEQLQQLVAAFPPPAPAPAAQELEPGTPAGRSVAGPKGAYRRTDLLGVLRDGSVPARYPSASEARMAALCSLASSGWEQSQVSEEITRGTFAGLGSLYARYSPTHRAQAFAREWAKAQAFTASSHPGKPRERSVGKSDMNPALPSQAGGWDEHGFIRRIRSVLDIYDLRLRAQLPARQVPGAQMLLRALLAFGHMTSSRELAVGCRSLALATGMCHQSAAKLLTQLAQIPGSPIRLKYKGVGLEADTYLIVTDEDLEPTAERRGMARGKIHALRPVFRALGPICALVYEGLERMGEANLTELATYTGLHRGTVRDALHAMLTHKMITRTGAAWRVEHTANLSRLARDLGSLDEFENQLLLYRAHRKLWREVVAAHQLAQNGEGRYVSEAQLWDEERETYWVPPPDASRPLPELTMAAA